jgi:hypothetical protein
LCARFDSFLLDIIMRLIEQMLWKSEMRTEGKREKKKLVIHFSAV